MATCYYLLNHTKQEYLDLGKLVGGHIAQPTSYFYSPFEQIPVSAGAVVLYLMQYRGDATQWVSDVEGDLDFLANYHEFDLQSLLSAYPSYA